MFRNADTIQAGTTLEGFDICIAGGGVAGLAIASRLTGANAKVLVLLNGEPTDDGETPDPARQSIYAGTTGEFMQKVRPEFLTVSRLNMFGGTSNHFWFNAHPLERPDLEPRPGFRDSFWPITLDELNRYSAEANQFGDYGPFNYSDIPYWSNALNGHPWDPLPSDAFLNVVWRGQHNLNISHFQKQLGPGLKAAANVTVLFNAHVLKVQSNESRGHVTGLDCSTIQGGKPGTQFKIGECRAFVLALGGIEPVRLLRISNDLGDNAQGLLGRGFMLHPVIWDTAKVDLPQPMDPLVHNFYRGQVVTVGDTTEGSPPLIRRRPSDPLDLGGNHQFSAWGMLAPTPELLAERQIGNFHVTQSMNDEATEITLGLNWESAPNPESKITLDPSAVDPVFGQPTVRVDWNLLESDKRTVTVALEKLKEFYAARGGSNFRIMTQLDGGPGEWTFSPDFTDPAGLRPGDHHMGALRMSAAPCDGIVDPNCKVHTVDNLFIAGSSVFPTSGHANPTLALVALALRLADHLKNCIPSIRG